MISFVSVSGRLPLVLGQALTLLLCTKMPAQTLLSSVNGQVHLVGSDLAVLEAQDVRKEINCTVTPQKPALGFDLRYHAGFSVTVPLKELAGEENSLTILFRVTPQGQSASPAYFIQRYTVPSIVEDAGGDALLQGSLDLGEGKYHVDWMMRDRIQQVCSSYWDMEATLSSKARRGFSWCERCREYIQREQFGAHMWHMHQLDVDGRMHDLVQVAAELQQRDKDLYRDD